MIVRLLLALLLASFAVPATAAAPVCHGEATTMTHHGAPAPEKMPSAHVCIGCVPLADWLGTRIDARVLPRAERPWTGIARLDLRRATAPALPPPRIA